MSSIVCGETEASRESISSCDKRKLAGDQRSNFAESSRTATSPRALTSAIMFATVSWTLLFAASISAAGMPVFRYLAIVAPQILRLRGSALNAGAKHVGFFARSYLARGSLPLNSEGMQCQDVW